MENANRLRRFRSQIIVHPLQGMFSRPHITKIFAAQTVVSICFDAYNEIDLDKDIIVSDVHTFKGLLFMLHIT